MGGRMRTFDRRSSPRVEFSESQEKLTEETVSESQAGENTTLQELSPKKEKSPFKFAQWLLPFVLLAGLCSLYFVYEWQKHSKLFVPIPSPEQISLRPLVTFEFQDPSFFQEWKEHVFRGRTLYQIETIENGEKILHATSHGTSSVLFKQVNLGLSERPFLTWEWKAIRFPSNKQNKVLAAKSDNDFVARIYVGFRGRTPLTSDVIQYVWDDHFPVGASVGSPFARSNKVLVIQSSQTAPPGTWIAEKRDLIADYRKLFGKSPHGNVIAIGLMSDSDNTGTESEAYFRRLFIQKPK